MKKLLLLPIMLISIYSYCQNGIANANDFMYKPPYKLMQQALAYHNAKYESNQNQINELIGYSNKSFSENNYEGMLYAADLILKIENKSKKAYLIKSIAYYNKGEILNAYNFGCAQLDLDNDISFEWYNEITSYFFANIRENLSKENYEQVQYHCENVVFKNVYSYYYLGLALYYQSEFQTAKEFFKKAKEIKQSQIYLEAIESKKIIKNPIINL